MNKKVWIVLTVVAIIAAVVVGVVGGNKASSLNKTIDELNAKVASLEGDLAAANEAAKTASEAQTAADELNKTIEELNAKVAALETELAAAKDEAEKAKAEVVPTPVPSEEPKVEATEEPKAEATEEPKAEETAAPAAQAAAEGTPVAAGKTVVTIWSTFTDAQKAYLEKTAADFTASQDQYEVVVQDQPRADFNNNVYNGVVNGVGPDIIFNYASEAASYVNAGLVANLDEYIYDETIGIPDFDELLPQYLLDEMNAMEDGHIHWIPGVTTGPILYYNKTLLDELQIEVPTTWDELVAACDKIREAKPDVLPFGIDSLTDILQTFIMEAGHGYIDTEKKEVTFGDAVDVIKWYGEQCQNGNFAITPPSGNYFSDDFNTGKVAMYYGSCAGVPYIKPVDFEYGTAKAPVTAGGKGAYSIWNRGPIVFHYEGQEAREVGAYLFVKYMLATAEVSEGWAEAMEALTPWKNAQQVEGYDAFVAAHPALQAVSDNFDIGVTFPSVTGAAQVRNAIKEMGTLVAGGTDAAEALAACVETCNNALQGK